MIEIDVPGFNKLQLSHLVLDYNGTLAFEGRLIEGAGQRLETLSSRIEIHILTADTFGKVQSEIGGIACRLSIIPAEEDQALSKLNYIEQLGTQGTVCIGNGRNDCRMLKETALGIAVLQEEGMAVEAVMAADVVAPDILTALDLLTHPLRLIATLRS